MSVVVITGAAGLVGSVAAERFAARGMDIVGIDNDMRSRFFGDAASTAPNRTRLQASLGKQYEHLDLDIRDEEAIDGVFSRYGSSISAVIHTAAQPSHDWAARDPKMDFSTNAFGTLNLLEAVRQHCPTTTFIFTSTNKVYGDRPNSLPLVEHATRWELASEHPWREGVPEEMSVDQCLHSLFGASKISADILVQEYGRYFDIPTACFRAGCITGPGHAPAELHGFLAYLVRCVAEGTRYRIFGYKGKQVRDNIHAADLVSAFECFMAAPRTAEVYNIGGARYSNCSLREALDLAQDLVGREALTTYEDGARVGDHIWWISDVSKFQRHYPEWRLTYNVFKILEEIVAVKADEWQRSATS